MRVPRFGSSAKSVRRWTLRIFFWWAWRAFHDGRVVRELLAFFMSHAPVYLDSLVRYQLSPSDVRVIGCRGDRGGRRASTDSRLLMTKFTPDGVHPGGLHLRRYLHSRQKGCARRAKN